MGAAPLILILGNLCERLPVCYREGRRGAGAWLVPVGGARGLIHCLPRAGDVIGVIITELISSRTAPMTGTIQFP